MSKQWGHGYNAGVKAGSSGGGDAAAAALIVGIALGYATAKVVESFKDGSAQEAIADTGRATVAAVNGAAAALGELFA